MLSTSKKRGPESLSVLLPLDEETILLEGAELTPSQPGVPGASHVAVGRAAVPDWARAACTAVHLVFCCITRMDPP